MIEKFSWNDEHYVSHTIPALHGFDKVDQLIYTFY